MNKQLNVTNFSSIENLKKSMLLYRSMYNKFLYSKKMESTHFVCTIYVLLLGMYNTN